MSHIVFFKWHQSSPIDPSTWHYVVCLDIQRPKPLSKILYQVECKKSAETAGSQIHPKTCCRFARDSSFEWSHCSGEEAAQPRGTTSSTKTSFLTNTRNKELSTSWPHTFNSRQDKNTHQILFFPPVASWLSPSRSTRSIGMQHVPLI